MPKFGSFGSDIEQHIAGSSSPPLLFQDVSHVINKLGLNSSINSKSVHTPGPVQSGMSQYGSTSNGFPTADDIPEAPAFQAPHLHKAQSHQVRPPPSLLTDSHPRSTNDGFANMSYASPTLMPAITDVLHMVISRLRVMAHCPKCGHGLIYSVNKL